jgi:cytoskeleton protein RodZ
LAYRDSFGSALHNQRLNVGLTLSSVAHQLRIRPDILEAIENEDFSKMPPVGYSKSMIAAYGKLLHLNERELIDSYLKKVNEAPSDNFRSSGASDRNLSSYRQNKTRNYSSTQSGANVQSHTSAQRNTGARNYLYDSSAYSRNSNVSTGASSRNANTANTSGASRLQTRSRSVALPNFGRNGSSGATSMSHQKRLDYNHSIYSDLNKPDYITAANKTRKKNNQAQSYGASQGYGASSGSMSGASSALRSKLPFILIALVLILVLVFLMTFLFGNGSSGNTNSAEQTTSITGLTDPGDDSATEAPQVIRIAPTAAVFSYEVASDSQVYIEIYIDGSSSPEVAETITGPAYKTYDVTGTLSFVCTNPNAVTLILDGETVEMSDDNGDGVYTYDVDFSSILEAWKAENETQEEQTGTSSDETSSTETSE